MLMPTKTKGHKFEKHFPKCLNIENGHCMNESSSRDNNVSFTYMSIRFFFTTVGYY